MHNTTRLWIGGVVGASLLLVAFAGSVMAADPTPKPADPKPAATEAPIQTLTGVVSTGKDADGDPTYLLDKLEISAGPAWFWGTKNPLQQYVGQSVTVTGRTETRPASKKSTTTAADPGTPEFEAVAVNGAPIRAAGKPPWAGGPKAVGSKHPGFVHP